MDTQLIAFYGPAGCGKSVAARFLAECGGDFVLVKFASPLKDMLRAFYRAAGLPPEEIERRIEGDLKEVPCQLLRGQTPRFAMQTIGTEWGRDIIAADLWVNAWRSRVEKLRAGGMNVVVDDLRFPNEAALIRGMGGEVVKVEGRAKRLEGSHSSEAFEIEPDWVLANTGTIKDLEDRIIARWIV